MGSRTFVALAGLTVLLASQASAVGPLHPLPIECDLESGGASGGDSYQDYTGHQQFGDAFPDCFSPSYWNGTGSYDDVEPVLRESDASVTSDGTSVTVSASLTLDLPPDFIWAQARVSIAAHGRFRVPVPAGSRASLSPATLTFEVARSGQSPDAGVSARVEGPGVDVRPGLGTLPDGVHHFDTWLVPGETYRVVMSASAEFEETDSYSGSVRFSVAAPEPARPLLLLVGGAALALRARRAARS